MIIKEENQRSFFRINLATPLCSKVSIDMIKNKEVKTKEVNTCIKDIGPGGLSFLSHLEFPVREDIILNFTVILLKRKMSFQGKIVRTQKIAKRIWKYGVRFDVNEMIRLQYMRLFNQLAIDIAKKKSMLLYSFCTNKEMCIKKRAS